MNSISEETSKRICIHMNKDHIDSVHKYLRHYGEVTSFKDATMSAITSEYMLIKYDNKNKKIFFPEEISESEVHNTLVKMAKAIRAI